MFILIEPFSFVYVVFIKKKFKWERLSGYFRSVAIDIDRFGNHHFRSLFNALLIKQNGYPFGDFRETISSVLGKNIEKGTLTTCGRVLVFILSEKHCIKAIQHDS